MKHYFIPLILFLTALSVQAQNLSNLTPEQLELYRKYAGKTASTKSTIDESENLERSYSNETSNFSKSSNIYGFKPDSLLSKEEADYVEFKRWQSQNKKNNKLEVFGQQFFSNQKLTFEPKLNIPTPPNYVLGAYDELIIDLTGLYEANYKLKVSPDGSIRIPAVGLVKVSGQTIDVASSNIRSRMAKIYTGLSSGETKVNISLGNIRSIRVSVIGEAARPGTYTLPSLATTFNALYACGGPGKMGSLRNIKVLRNGKIIANLDMYRFLVDGIMIDNITLQDEDVIKIEPYQKRISITGEIKHEAIFEAIANETLLDLIGFAGGYTENASTKLITAFRLTEQGKTVIDVSNQMIPNFILQSGDTFNVTSIYNKFDNKVQILGEVLRPGSYALDPGMTVKQLLLKADGLSEDAFMDLASIYRKRENTSPEVISFDLKKLLNNEIKDIPLLKNDSVHISNYIDFEKNENISIWGEILVPGNYKLNHKMSVKDLVYLAKGFTSIALKDTLELVRVINDPKTLKTTDKKSILIKVPFEGAAENAAKNIFLQNNDQVIVRSISGYEEVRMVKAEGEVLNPGSYNILNKQERISDLLKRSGGLTKFAYTEGAYLIRKENTSGVEAILRKKMVETAKKQLESQSNLKMDSKLLENSSSDNFKEVKEQLTGTKTAEEILKTEGIVGINLDHIIKNPKSVNDLLLEDGDILYVPRELQTIRVIGEVLFPTYVSYRKGMKLNAYVGNAGGYSDQAQKSKTFVLYANGTAKTTSRFLGFSHYPEVKPGSYIIVPQKPTIIKDKISTIEVVSIMSSLATIAVLIVSVFK